MGANSVTFELRAEDLGATATAERVGGKIAAQQDTIAAREQAAAGRARQHEAAVGSAERGQRKLATAIENTTNTTNLTATALTRMRGLLLGLAQGAVIGAVAALAAQFFTTRKNVEDLTASVVGQAAKWDPYRAKLDEVRASTVALYNDQLRLLKLQERDTGERLERQIAHLENMRKQNEAAARDLRRPEGNRDRFALAVAEQTVEIDKQKIKLEEWERTMALEPLTVAQVKIAVPDDAGGAVALLQQSLDLVTSIRDADRARVERDTLAHDQWKIDQTRATNDALFAEHDAHTKAMLELDKMYSQVHQQGALALGTTLLSAANIKSKAIFALSKALGVAQIFVATNVAAAEALAHPPGPPTTIPLAASVKAWGYANAAATAAIGMAQTFSGGGGGGAVGGPSVVSSVPASAREIGPSASAQPLPQTINIYIDGNLVDLSQLSRELRPYQIQLTKDTI